MSNIYSDADLAGIIAEMQAATADSSRPFVKAVISLIEDINIYHQPDTDGDCEAPGCQSQYGDPDYNIDWPCPVWMRANNVAVAWLRERAAEVAVEDPQRVASRERKARQRQRAREASESPEASGNPGGDRVTTTSPGDPFSEKSQVDESRPSGQARDSQGDTPSSAGVEHMLNTSSLGNP